MQCSGFKTVARGISNQAVMTGMKCSIEAVASVSASWVPSLEPKPEPEPSPSQSELASPANADDEIDDRTASLT